MTVYMVHKWFKHPPTAIVLQSGEPHKPDVTPPCSGALGDTQPGYSHRRGRRWWEMLGQGGKALRSCSTRGGGGGGWVGMVRKIQTFGARETGDDVGD